MKDFNAGGINLADDRDLIVRAKFFCTTEIWTVRVIRPCPENKWPFSPALLNAWEGLSYKANIGLGTNKQDSDQPVHFRCQNLVFTSISMNSENVDTELSRQMLKLPCALFGGPTVHSAQGKTL